MPDKPITHATVSPRLRRHHWTESELSPSAAIKKTKQGLESADEPWRTESLTGRWEGWMKREMERDLQISALRQYGNTFTESSSDL
ncbi:uncharacterized protein LOC143752355 [Siphateles boraxobius]|uniref:uncharacterized protein LOC143752355 n=1 Tax=Siphateles boraxobius TaxID=180520 RepID=UPI004063686B